ncbi:MAG: TIGR02757 family protein [Bacteroidales bacterium]|nr:TIGR02757 family protein [Bacteroidales bacterium]
MGLSLEDINDLLNEKAAYYERPWFIEDDPVSIPHMFTAKEDREIAGFLAASIAWGQRPVILKNASGLMKLMDYSPHDFILNATPGDLEYFRDFKHRTFNGEDCMFFMRSLQRMYQDGNGLFQPFYRGYLERKSIKDAILNFRNEFFLTDHQIRSRKHIADPGRGSAAKRINLFLRWMVRKDDAGVDLGIWDGIDPAQLYIPLDVHSGNVARRLGILHRKQNDWEAVEELTAVLRGLDPSDPVKYDYALFGLGVFERL